MQFITKNTSFFSHPLATRIDAAAADLEKKLRTLLIEKLSLSEYGKNYYAYDMRKLHYMLQSYSVMLLESVLKTGKKIEDACVIDHGGGIGIFSLLAKLAGAGTVICQDINPVISKDAELIAKRSEEHTSELQS